VPALLEVLSQAGPTLHDFGCWRHRRKDGTELIAEITAHELTWAGRLARLVLAAT